MPGFELFTGALAKNIAGIIGGNKASVKVKDALGLESDKLTIKLSNKNKMFKVPTKGTMITAGVLGVPMGIFYVDSAGGATSASGGRFINISANAANMSKKLKELKSRSFDKKKLSEILGTIADDHGYELKIDDKFKDIKIEHIDQSKVSDMQFVTSLGVRYDAVAKWANGKLIFLKRGDAHGTIPIILPESFLSSYDFDYFARNDYTAAKAAYQDAGKNKEEFAQVGEGEGEAVKEVSGTFANKAEAKDAAQAQIDKLNRQKIRFVATMPLNPAIAAGSIVIPTGVDPFIDGPLYVTESEHSIASERMTKIVCEAVNES